MSFKLAFERIHNHLLHSDLNSNDVFYIEMILFKLQFNLLILMNIIFCPIFNSWLFSFIENDDNDDDDIDDVNDESV